MSIDRQDKRPGRRRKDVRGVEDAKDSAVDVEDPKADKDEADDPVEVDGVETDRDDIDESTLDEVGLDEEEEDEEAPKGRSAPTRRSTSTLAPRRTNARQFLHEVNVEMRKVAWPSRSSTINYATVVIVTLILITAMIFGLDYAFVQLANYFFK